MQQVFCAGFVWRTNFCSTSVKISLSSLLLWMPIEGNFCSEHWLVPDVCTLLEQPEESIQFHWQAPAFQRLPKHGRKILTCLTPLLQIRVHPSFNTTKEYSYCHKCNSLFNSLLLCKELLLITTFCTCTLQHMLLHLQYSPIYTWGTGTLYERWKAGSCGTSADWPPCHRQNQLLSHQTPPQA